MSDVYDHKWNVLSVSLKKFPSILINSINNLNTYNQSQKEYES